VHGLNFFLACPMSYTLNEKVILDGGYMMSDVFNYLLSLAILCNNSCLPLVYG
jgi:hypothetical protein